MRSLAEGLQLMHSLDITGCPFDQTIQVKLEKARLNIERGLVDAENLEDEYLGQDPRELYGLVLATKPTVEDLVFTHGDYCFPNVIVHDGKLSGFIDLGRAGVSDRYQDLALAVRSFRHNSYSEKWVEFFLEVYGVERLDQAKIDFFILLTSSSKAGTCRKPGATKVQGSMLPAPFYFASYRMNECANSVTGTPPWRFTAVLSRR